MVHVDGEIVSTHVMDQLSKIFVNAIIFVRFPSMDVRFFSKSTTI